MPSNRLAWVDCWSLEHESAVDDMVRLYGDNDGDERCDDDSQWKCCGHDGIWAAGCGCEWECVGRWKHRRDAGGYCRPRYGSWCRGAGACCWAVGYAYPGKRQNTDSLVLYGSTVGSCDTRGSSLGLGRLHIKETTLIR